MKKNLQRMLFILVFGTVVYVAYATSSEGTDVREIVLFDDKIKPKIK